MNKPIVNPSIELVINEQTGCLAQCFVLNSAGERTYALPLTEVRESFTPRTPGIVSLDIHSFRVKRTMD